MGRLGDFCKRLLSLDSAQRQAMMSLGMLLGLVALTAVIVITLFMLHGFYDGSQPETRRTIIDALFGISLALCGLMAVLVGGVIAIAHNANLKASISKDGATVDIDARGGAAREAAKDLRA